MTSFRSLSPGQSNSCCPLLLMLLLWLLLLLPLEEVALDEEGEAREDEDASEELCLVLLELLEWDSLKGLIRLLKS